MMVTDTNKVSLKMRIGYGAIQLVIALVMYTLGAAALATTPYAGYAGLYGIIVAFSAIYLTGWIPVGQTYLNCKPVKA